MVGLNLLLNLILICIEAIILVGFLVIYFRQKNAVLKPLIWTITFLLLSNIFSFVYFLTQTGILDWTILIVIVAQLLTSAALITLVHYLELFDSKDPYTKRSTIAIILILITGIPQMLSNFVGGTFVYIGLLTPLPIFITGIIYLKHVRKIRNRAKVTIQKKRINRVHSGVFMIFISPVLFYLILGVLSFIAVIFTPPEFSLDIARNSPTFNLGSMDPIVMLCQLMGVILISLPVLLSRSTYFMQSCKISRLIVIIDSGLPVYDFNFESVGKDKELLLSGALTAIKSIMKEATGTSEELKAIEFGDMHIITEVREGLAINLLVENSTAYLKEALRLFADDFLVAFKDKYDPVVINQDLMKAADLLVQKNFCLTEEEFIAIQALQHPAEPFPV